jgi:UDP-3-O-[3-hydroxymyristoyl] glucosamine N-acyltransferase
MSGDHNESIELARILEVLGEAVLDVFGPKDRAITHPAPIDDAHSASAITFSDKGRAPYSIRTTGAGVVLCPPGSDDEPQTAEDKTLIIVAEPRMAFIRVLGALFIQPKPRGVHPTAVVDPKARVHAEAYVGPFSHVGECEIGARSVIHGHAHIYSKTRIGQDVVIQAGAVIGGNGFIYPRNEKGEPEFFPHVGGVIIEDGVEIGVNTCIDRGTLTNTVVGRGTKIDNLVHIAHTVTIGRRCLIAAGAVVAGNVTIGDDVWIGPGVTVNDSVSIGDRAGITLGSVVGTTVGREKNMTGFFAVDHAKFLDAWKKMRRSTTRTPNNK